MLDSEAKKVTKRNLKHWWLMTEYIGLPYPQKNMFQPKCITLILLFSPSMMSHK